MSAVMSTISNIPYVTLYENQSLLKLKHQIAMKYILASFKLHGVIVCTFRGTEVFGSVLARTNIFYANSVQNYMVSE